MRHLTAVSQYGWDGASSRVRILDWLNHTGQKAEIYGYLGLSTNPAGALARRPIRMLDAEQRLRRLSRQKNDVLLISRAASPFSSGKLEERLLTSAAHGVLDLDDALQWDQRKGLDPARLFPAPQRTIRAAKAANRVIVGSTTLLDWASTLHPDVHLIPSCIETDSYPCPASYAVHDPPRMVWLGSPTTERYLGLVTDALLEINRQTGAELVVISAGNQALGKLSSITRRVAWGRESFYGDLVDCDVAIAPLADTLFARGKCAYKILQYGATGLPTVASPIGANHEAIAKLGLSAASTTDEWVGGIVELINMSSVNRQQLGRAIKQATSVHYSYASWSDEWKQLLELG